MSVETVFLSYASADRARIQPIVTALEDQGFDVWWDRDIPRGKSFSRAIEEALGRARCAVVVWSRASVASEWVVNEASVARQRGIMVPVLIDAVEPPLEFRHLQAADLCEWNGATSDKELAGLLEAIRELVKIPGAAPPGITGGVALPAAAKHWWQTPAGLALGGGALLGGLAVFLMALRQVGWVGVGPPEASVSARPVVTEPRNSATGPATLANATESPPVGKVEMTEPDERTNLLLAETGGQLLLANEEGWRYLMARNPTATTLSSHGFAVFGFLSDRPMTIDAVGVFVESTSDRNVKQLAVSASDESENGPFRRIAVLDVPNYRNMRAPFHEFKVGPFTARYVKIELESWQGGQFPNGYVGSLALLGRVSSDAQR